LFEATLPLEDPSTLSGNGALGDGLLVEPLLGVLEGGLLGTERQGKSRHGGRAVRYADVFHFLILGIMHSKSWILGIWATAIAEHAKTQVLFTFGYEAEKPRFLRRWELSFAAAIWSGGSARNPLWALSL
jgi:hypothetical protein